MLNHMTPVMIFFAKYVYLLVILLAIIFTLLQPRQIQKKILILAVITLPVTYIVAFLAGKIYFDPRPFVLEHIKPLIPHAANNGFPSDHTLITSAIAAILFVFHKKWGILAGLLALLVGVGRVYARIHSPIDIIGSFVISILVMSVVIFLSRKFFRFGV